MNSDKNRMDQLKEAYGSIPVPEALCLQVQASIAQAKRDQKKEAPQMKKTRPYLRNTAAGAAAAMLAIVVLANSSPAVAHAMEQVPLLGAITKVFTFRIFSDKTGTTEARVDVPQVEGGGDALNAAIEEYTNAIIEEYKRDAAYSEDYAADPDAPPAETNHYALDLSYTVVTDNDALFALRFDKLVEMAGGTQSVKIYNLDKGSGKILTLSQLFRDGDAAMAAVSDSIKRQMAERMAADDSLHYWLNDEVAAWNFQSVTDETAFYVNGDGALVIVFNEGDVAPMYMGVVEFTIPTEELGDLALPGYLK